MNGSPIALINHIWLHLISMGTKEGGFQSPFNSPAQGRDTIPFQGRVPIRAQVPP